MELTCDYREFDTTADIMMASISPLGRQVESDYLVGHPDMPVPPALNGHHPGWS